MTAAIQPAGPSVPVAVFDVDGTLTDRDTFVPFLLTAAGRARTARALQRSVRQWRAGGRDAAKAAAVHAALAGRAVGDLEELGEAYAELVLRRRMRPAVVARLEVHQAKGHRTALVSASLSLYIGPLGRRLGVDDVSATELEVVDGHCTGRLRGGNCRGPEKVVRLRRLLGDRPEELWAYGDSAGDREMLAWSTHPCWVQRGVVTGPSLPGSGQPTSPPPGPRRRRRGSGPARSAGASGG